MAHTDDTHSHERFVFVSGDLGTRQRRRQDARVKRRVSSRGRDEGGGRILLVH